LVAPDTWRRWVEQAPIDVRQWSETNPIDPRMPTAALRRALGLPDDALLDPVLAETELGVSGGRVVDRTTASLTPSSLTPSSLTPSSFAGSSLAASSLTASSLGPAEPGVRALEQRLRDRPFAAPERDQLAELGLGRRELAAAEHVQRLLRISDDIVLLPDAPNLATVALRALPQPFTTSQARQALDTTRRVAIPLLEYLDRTGRSERIDQQHRHVLE